MFFPDVSVSASVCKESFPIFCVFTDHLCILLLFVVKGLEQLPIFAVICNPTLVFSKAFQPFKGLHFSRVARLSFVLNWLGCFLLCLSGRRSGLSCAWSDCMSPAWLCCRIVSVGKRGTLSGTLGSMSTSCCVGLASFPVLNEGIYASPYSSALSDTFLLCLHVKSIADYCTNPSGAGSIS